MSRDTFDFSEGANWDEGRGAGAGLQNSCVIMSLRAMISFSKAIILSSALGGDSCTVEGIGGTRGTAIGTFALSLASSSHRSASPNGAVTTFNDGVRDDLGDDLGEDLGEDSREGITSSPLLELCLCRLGGRVTDE